MQEANTNSTGGLDTGAWVAISISIAAVVALLVFAVWYTFFRKGATRTLPAIFRPSPTTDTDTRAGGSHARVGEWRFTSLLYTQTQDTP